MNQQYDYIIVGAGSCGCVLANKLSANAAHSVLLVESGPSDRGTFIDMPRGVGAVNSPKSKLNWHYKAHAQVDRPTERWYKGRALGGSSSINGMVYMRGAPADYDGWEQLGCQGWGWADIGAKFKELEGHVLGASTWRGGNGPQKISIHPAGDPLLEAILNAAVEHGTPRVSDINDVNAVHNGGVGYQPCTIWDGRRYSAARAFLEPARGRPNLTVLTQTNAVNIEFEGRRATAVKLRNKDGDMTVRARQEIILSAGAIESPRLLQLSGIGPAALLKSHGIEVVMDSPNVGRNLREHRQVSVQYRVRGHSHNTALGGVRVVGPLLQYFLSHKGPMTHCVHEIGGYFKTDPALEQADGQFGLLLFSMSGSSSEKILLDKFPGITFVGYFARPTSQGEIRIQSADFEDPPYINAAHFCTEEDCRKVVAVFRWLRALGSRPALRDWIEEEVSPGPRLQTDEEILARAVDLGSTCFHVCGTAKMGSDPGAVVDPQLRVIGVQGLRVVDTSIMPTIVSANTNGPAMAIALRAADFICSSH